MKNIKTFEEFINEGPKTQGDIHSPNFYANNNEGDYPDLNTDYEKVVKDMFAVWKKEPLSDAVIDAKLKKEVLDLAKEYTQKYKKISGNIVNGMIMMLGA